MSPQKPSRPPVSHDLRLFLMALAAGFPAVLVSMIMLWTGDYTAKVQWTLTVLIAGCWLTGDAVVVVEERAGVAVAVPDGLTQLDTRSYGDTEIIIFRRSAPAKS